MALRLRCCTRRTLAGVAAAGALAVAAAAPQRHTVVIEGMAFHPATLAVKRGDRVVWVNKDIVPHTATASDRRALDTGRIDAGKSSRAVTVSRSGTLDYICAYHPTMKATLVVER